MRSFASGSYLLSDARFEVTPSEKDGLVTIDGLPRNEAFLAGLASELKRACGSGGTVAEGRIEIQGDQRERLRELLGKRGWTVKG